MLGHVFHKYTPAPQGSKFDELLKLFLQLMQYTNGDVAETLDWMNELDKQYKLTDNNYGMGDFIEDLKNKGYIKDDPQDVMTVPTSKTNQSIRKNALNEIFGKLKKTPKGTGKIIVNFNSDSDLLRIIELLNKWCDLYCW